MFTTQANTGRGAPLAASRLHTGKLGASQWGFGAPARNNGSALSSFAQAMAGSQPHTPLNLDEFPSLSGAPHAQHASSSQQLWSNPTVRASQQQQTIQRPPGQQAPPSQHAAQQPPSHVPDDSSQSQFSSAADDYRFGGAGGVGPLASGAQPQPGSMEEFPPLGGAGGEMGPDRRAGLIQNAAAFANHSTTAAAATAAAAAFPGLGQTRNGLTSPTDPLSRQFDGMRANPPSQAARRTAQAPGNLSMAARAGGEAAPGGQRPQPRQFDQTYGSDALASPSTQPLHKKLADMSDGERYGLPGLLSMIPLESPDYSSLAMGQDLTVLGLELSRPDHSPLHPTFGSPFVESTSKPVIPPSFTLPAAYTVSNVPPLHSKMSSFSAETLLAIFYQYPRDILQEIAAAELYNRDWRWHINLRQWMMKDPDLPAPIRLSPKEERGWYLFFDVGNWRRERREFELNYDHLDQRHGSPAMATQM